MSDQNISFTPEKFERFKEEYQKHKDDPKAVFSFEGHEFLVGYAKYMIEYLETQFEKVKNGH